MRVDGDRGVSVIGLYVRPRASRGHELLTRVSASCGVDANSVLAEVHESGLSRALWTGDMVVKVEAPGAGTSAPDARFAVHLAGAAAGGPDQAWALVRPALRQMVGNVADTEELIQRRPRTGSPLEVGALGHRPGLPSRRRPPRHQRVPRPRRRALSERLRSPLAPSRPGCRTPGNPVPAAWPRAPGRGGSPRAGPRRAPAPVARGDRHATA